MRAIPFDNTYANLPPRFFTAMPPSPVAEPAIVAINDDLARSLGIDPDWLRGADGLAALSGNAVPEGAEPLAQVYAGHQFGGWSPQLGDGRALLLGEVVDQTGTRRDIQLKGSGPTPYSRMGDGRAWLGPVMREYLLSEAMFALGIPTTRALAMVTTGEVVRRERALPGAVLTRVAASHLRVGTFQYFAARDDVTGLQALTDYAIARHYPGADGPLGLLRMVVAAQADLIARWMGLGFIHGVMNTDNMTISGETIDYGPCAFMDVFHPAKVFSSIDQYGRYAFNKQPDMAHWNLAQLASALLPVIDADVNAAIEAATEVLNDFPALFQDAWLRVHRAKLGLTTAEDGDIDLIHALLQRMSATGADFTNTFRALPDGTARDQFSDPAAFDQWAVEWTARRTREGRDADDMAHQIRAANPAIIPRNHRVEEAIEAGLQGDFTPFRDFHMALKTPFDTPADPKWTRPPTADQEVHRTFCGT